MLTESIDHWKREIREEAKGGGPGGSPAAARLPRLSSVLWILMDTDRGAGALCGCGAFLEWASASLTVESPGHLPGPS